MEHKDSQIRAAFPLLQVIVDLYDNKTDKKAGVAHRYTNAASWPEKHDCLEEDRALCTNSYRTPFFLPFPVTQNTPFH
jgi:hypothetical protein